MSLVIPLDKLTLAEKQEAIEILWQDLYAHEEELDVPEWQAEILREREKAAAEGNDPTMTLDEVRRRFQEEYRCG